MTDPDNPHPDDWPLPRRYPGDDSDHVGHGPGGDRLPDDPIQPAGGAETANVFMPCKDFSPRGRARIVAAVFHTAEGARTVESLGRYFQDTTRAVSSNVGIDTDGDTGRYVPDVFAAWTNPDVNSYTVTCELCVFARWTEGQWLAEPRLLEAAARWAAQVHRDHRVPLRWITPAQLNKAVAANDPGQGGFCDHYTVTVARRRVGGHTDCGPGFRGRVKDQILSRAREIAYPTPPKENPEMPAAPAKPCPNGEVPKSSTGRPTTWADWFRRYWDDLAKMFGRVDKLEADSGTYRSEIDALTARLDEIAPTEPTDPGTETRR